jgi:ferrochelatase
MQTAIVLMNLGTPAAPTAAAIRSYLREFLSDPRVVEIPRSLWYPILYGPILMLRPARLASAYQLMWDHYGDSPLRVISQRQVTRLQQKLDEVCANPPLVRLAMTYGEPKLPDVIAELRAAGVEHTVVLPLYPQYSATTTAPIYDQVGAVTAAARDIPSIAVVKQYWDHPAYIETLAQSVLDHWQQHGRAERLLMSFHGIPKRNVERGDPYGPQCQATAERLASRLGLQRQQWQISFQSRLGRAEWLQPYTSATLLQWGAEQLASVDVICPAFAADCLETLEEIAVENRGVFQRSGGGDFRYIACLNDSDAHIAMLVEILKDHVPQVKF